MEVGLPEIVFLALDGLPVLQEVTFHSVQIIPGAFFFDPLPSGMHVAVDRVKEVFLAVDSLPAKEHPAVAVKVIDLLIDLLEALGPDSIGVEVVGVTVDLLEFGGGI